MAAGLLLALLIFTNLNINGIVLQALVLTASAGSLPPQSSSGLVLPDSPANQAAGQSLTHSFEQVPALSRPAGGNEVHVSIDPSRLALEGYVALCTVIKDQPRDLVEWIEWHRCLGVRHFYVYDHNSTEPMLPEIMAYVQEGLVMYNYLKGWKMNADTDGGFHTSVQYYAYLDCTKRARDRHTFLGYLDADEFLVPTSGPGDDYDVEVPDLAGILKQFEPYGGLAVNWRFFGTSGHDARPQQTAPEAYTKCFPPDNEVNRHVKVIGNTKYIASISKANPHSLEYPQNSTAYTVDEHFRRVDGHATTDPALYSKLALYHYVTKSRQEYMAKVRRGAADGAHKTADWLRIIDVQCTDSCLDAVRLARACKLHSKITQQIIPAMQNW